MSCRRNSCCISNFESDEASGRMSPSAILNTELRVIYIHQLNEYLNISSGKKRLQNLHCKWDLPWETFLVWWVVFSLICNHQNIPMLSIVTPSSDYRVIVWLDIQRSSKLLSCNCNLIDFNLKRFWAPELNYFRNFPILRNDCTTNEILISIVFCIFKAVEIDSEIFLASNSHSQKKKMKHYLILREWTELVFCSGRLFLPITLTAIQPANLNLIWHLQFTIYNEILFLAICQFCSCCVKKNAMFCPKSPKLPRKKDFLSRFW